MINMHIQKILYFFIYICGCFEGTYMSYIQIRYRYKITDFLAMNESSSINVRTDVRRSCGGPIDQEERGGGVLHNHQSLNGT